MRFVVDNQLPPALARFIGSEFDCSSLHVIDIGLRNASDAEIWRYCSKSQSVLISRDEDFASMALQAPTAKLIWVRIGNCRKEFLLDVFRQVWPRLLHQLQSGAGIVELR